MELFGWQILKKQDEQPKSVALSAPQNDDGATVVAPSTSAAYYGIYLDSDAAVKSDAEAVMTYREIAEFPEVDLALQEIVNEAIPQENDDTLLDLVLDKLEIDPQIKEMFQEEFKYILGLLKYKTKASDIFRQWYVDGRLVYQLLIDPTNPRLGLLETRQLEATKIRKIREVNKQRTQSGVDVVAGVEEYFVYNESGFIAQTASMTPISTAVNGIKISPDAVVYCTSGRMDPTSTIVRGYLHPAIKHANQLRMLEDAVVINRIARAPERRIFYIDVGNLPKAKADQYVKDIMNQYRNKMVYDAKTGTVRDDKKYMSMLEDFWLPRRDGNKGTEISTLEGAQNLSQLDDVEMFKQNLYQALNVPVSRIQGQDGFNLGRSVEISREEVKFQKFIDKLRRKFSELILEVFKRHLILKGLINNDEWEEMVEMISIRFQRDNYFAELKNQEILTSRLMVLQQVDQYLGKYFSKLWVQKNILKMSDEEIETMTEEIEAEMGDPTAQPSMMMPPMGGDPNMMGGMGLPPQMQPTDPYADQQDNGVPQ